MKMIIQISHSAPFSRDFFNENYSWVGRFQRTRADLKPSDRLVVSVVSSMPGQGPGAHDWRSVGRNRRSKAGCHNRSGYENRHDYFPNPKSGNNKTTKTSLILRKPEAKNILRNEAQEGHLLPWCRGGSFPRKETEEELQGNPRRIW